MGREAEDLGRGHVQEDSSLRALFLGETTDSARWISRGGKLPIANQPRVCNEGGNIQGACEQMDKSFLGD
jgi:hypothetical protein